MFDSVFGVEISVARSGSLPPLRIVKTHLRVHVVTAKSHMKASFLLLMNSLFSTLLSTSLGRDSDSIALQMDKNRVDPGTTILSPDHYWKLSMVGKADAGPYSLVISHNEFHQAITQSAKPDNRVCWSKSQEQFVVIKPLGFCTMVDVFAVDETKNSISHVFSSEATNRRASVDYLLQRWDEANHLAVFNVIESHRYLERRKPRLFATEYVYLDGKNGFQLSDHQ